MKMHLMRAMLLAACMLVLTTSTAAATSAGKALLAKPRVCETSCGGSWGAKEHAKVYAERHRSGTVTVEKCTPTGKNQAGVAQWICPGFWGNGPWHFRVGIDPYGYEVSWEEFT